MGLQNSISNLINRITTKSIKFIGNTVSRDSWTWFTFNQGARSNKVFLEEGYGSNPIVFMVINKIAEVVSSLPRVVEGPQIVQELLENPNTHQTKEEFKAEEVASLEVTGDLFKILTVGVGELSAEWRIAKPDTIDIKVNSIGEILYYEEDFGKTKVRHEIENVLHIKYTNLISDRNEGTNDYLYGMSKLNPSWCSVQASNEIFKAKAHIISHKGIAGVLSNESDVPLLPSHMEAQQKEWDKITGGTDNFGKVKVMNSKVKFTQLSMSPTDLKLIETQLDEKRTICGVYGLDSSLFNDPANTTYNNRREAIIAAYTNCYLPISKKIDNADAKFLSRRFGQPVTIEVDKEEIEVFQKEDIAQDETNIDNE